MTTHFMKLKTQPFEQIVSGQKIYELRLYDDKRRGVVIGDKIIFTNMQSGGQCEVKVIDVITANCFGEIYDNLPLEDLGYDKEDIASADPRDMEQYYSQEEQSKYGVVAFKIQLLSATPSN